MLSLLVVSASSFQELNDAHRALSATAETGKAPEIAAIHSRLGALYLQQGMLASAKFFFERALKADPLAADAKAGR